MNLNNLMALSMVAGMGATQKDAFNDTANKLLDTAKSAAVQLELKQISTAFTTEMAFDKLPGIKKDFSAFINDWIHSSGLELGERDGPHQDMWGNDYFLDEDKEYFYICSLGPDGDDGSDDDLCAKVRK